MNQAIENYGPITASPEGEIPFYYEAGRGFPLVLLHGIGSSGASWVGQLRALSRNHRVLAWDAPGYMKSAPLPQAAPVAVDYAHKLRALLDYLDLRSCYLLGHSLGALIAGSFAKMWPKQVAGLILADPAQGYARASEDVRNEKLSSRLAAFQKLGVAEFAKTRGPKLLSDMASDAQIELVCETMSQLNENGYKQAARMLASGDLLADAEQFHGPILVLCGSEDSITPPDSAHKLAAALRSAQYQTIEGAGHASYIEQPEQFNESVLTFIDSDSANKRRD
ncbi:MAG: alpha/beta hydrolase [Proteobacteria bacterium]|nr:MAG: alpha/beta hydrolase [Pseudomonadota bacterium]